MGYNPNIHHRRSIRLKGYDYAREGAYFITICCQDKKCRFGKIVIDVVKNENNAIVGATLAVAPDIQNTNDLNLQTENSPSAILPTVHTWATARVAPTIAVGIGMNKRMELNELGIIAYNEWINLSHHFPNFELDVFQIMPNHIHGIIVLKENNDDVGVTLAVAQPLAVAPDLCKINPAIGEIVGAYKSIVANACLKIYKSRNEFMGTMWQRNYYEHIIRSWQSYVNISDYIIDNPAKWEEDMFFID